MSSEDDLRDLIRTAADRFEPGADAIGAVNQRIARHHRQRIIKRYSAALIGASVVIGGVVWVLGSGHSGSVRVASKPPPSSVSSPTTAAPTTTPTTGATTTSVPTSTSVATTVPVSPAQVLDRWLAAHPQAVLHSTPTKVNGRMTAIVGVQQSDQARAIEVIAIDGAQPSVLATISLPAPAFLFDPTLPVQVADVTGDGQPDFLVRFQAADAQPGVVVSDDGGVWRLIPSSPGGVYIGRAPAFTQGRLTSVFNDCLPTCAAGHDTLRVWRFARAQGVFVTP